MMSSFHSLRSSEKSVRDHMPVITGILFGFALLLIGSGTGSYYYFLKHTTLENTSVMPANTVWVLLYSGLFGIAFLLLVIFFRHIFNIKTLTVQLDDYKSRAESEMILSGQMAQSLQSAEENHKTFLDLIGYAVFVLNPQGYIININHAGKNMIGSDDKTYQDLSFISLLHYEDQGKINAKIDGLDKLNTYQTHMRLKVSEDQFKNVHAIFSRATEPSECIIISVIDNDDQAYIRETLKATELNYRYIVENSGFGFFEMNADGALRSVDMSLVKMLGYDSESACYDDVTSLYNLMPNNDQYARNIREKIAGGEPVLEYECVIHNIDREPFWVALNLFSFKDKDSSHPYYRGHFKNIDGRKKAELALKAAKEETDMAVRSKSQFLANMTHELRTPLNAILGFSELMRTKIQQNDKDSVYESYVQDIHDSGKHLLKIINEILDIAKIDSGDFRLSEEEINISQTIQSVCDLKQDKIISRLITLDIQCDETFALVCDHKNMKQILLNLLNNAIQFTPEKSLITINVHRNPSGEISISVTDTGAGMSDEQIKLALEPFGAMPSFEHGLSTDVGYGLTLTKALMKAHGGTFELISQRGMGTTAVITFPPYRTV